MTWDFRDSQNLTAGWTGGSQVKKKSDTILVFWAWETWIYVTQSVIEEIQSRSVGMKWKHFAYQNEWLFGPVKWIFATEVHTSLFSFCLACVYGWSCVHVSVCAWKKERERVHAHACLLLHFIHFGFLFFINCHMDGYNVMHTLTFWQFYLYVPFFHLQYFISLIHISYFHSKNVLLKFILLYPLVLIANLFTQQFFLNIFFHIS